MNEQFTVEDILRHFGTTITAKTDMTLAQAAHAMGVTEEVLIGEMIKCGMLDKNGLPTENRGVGLVGEQRVITSVYVTDFRRMKRTYDFWVEKG